MGIQAELKSLRERAEGGDAAVAEAAARRAGSIRDVLAGARAATDHPDVRGALEDGLAAAEETARRLEELAATKRAEQEGAEGEAAPGAGAAAAGTEAPGSGRGAGAKWPGWPPSQDVIEQAAEGLERLAAGVQGVLGQLAKELSRAADEFTRTPARCRKCGTALGEARFCPRCGTARG